MLIDLHKFISLVVVVAVVMLGRVTRAKFIGCLGSEFQS